MAALPGEAESGDRHVACKVSAGMLFAVVDGLGHGGEAATAANAAIHMLERYAHEPFDRLVWRCHTALRSTRGAVMSLASFNQKERQLCWLGVGNVAGLLVRADASIPDETLLLRGGVIGARLPPLQPAILPIAPGDVLVLATDGVGGDFAASVSAKGPLQPIAERVLTQHARGEDDALVLMARFNGDA
ncbi:MAG TPA: SpoIIE family protein phosphatase [Steroidobacteraceae bacterium]|nr:SpoIIE family protein phosphatase [Steroidobacteraceae bacterium]